MKTPSCAMKEPSCATKDLSSATKTPSRATKGDSSTTKHLSNATNDPWGRLVLSAIADEVVVLVAEELIEGGQGPVAPGDVLLQVDLLGVAELGMCVDLLFGHPQAVADHDDLVQELVDGDFARLKRRIPRLEDDRSAFPLGRELDVGFLEGFSEELLQVFAGHGSDLGELSE